MSMDSPWTPMLPGLTCSSLTFSVLYSTYLYLPILCIPVAYQVVYQAVYQALFAGETGDKRALVLLPKAGLLAELPVPLPQDGQAGAGLP